jgi:hypothetical protein
MLIGLTSDIGGYEPERGRLSARASFLVIGGISTALWSAIISAAVHFI